LKLSYSHLLEAQEQGQDVGVARVGVQQAVEQHALLHGHQRVDMLHIGRAAGHALDQRVDLGLLPGQQGLQPVWRDVRAARGKRVVEDLGDRLTDPDLLEHAQ